MTRVSDVMHMPAVTCAPTSTLCEVGQLMGRRQVGSVIVIDRVGEAAGIVMDGISRCVASPWLFR